MTGQGKNNSLPSAVKARRILIKTAAAASSAIFWIAVWAAAAYGADTLNSTQVLYPISKVMMQRE